jgi:hypothetical protein
MSDLMRKILFVVTLFFTFHFSIQILHAQEYGIFKYEEKAMAAPYLKE